MRPKEQRKLRHGGRKHLPMPLGPWSVGCVDLMTEYSKEGSFMRIYYPISNNRDDTLVKELQWPNWLPHEKYLNGYAYFLKVWKPLFKSLYHGLIGDVFIPAVWDAQPAKTDTGFPVIVFSHGLASCRTSYATICTELASHGYIVAAVEHRDHSACHSYYLKEVVVNGPYSEKADSIKDELKSELAEEKNEKEDAKTTGSGHSYAYPDNWDTEETFCNGNPPAVREWVPYQQISLKKKAYPERHKQLQQRSKECILALDILEALNKGQSIHNVVEPFFKGSRFKGTMDLSRAIISGHSFGGATVILTLAKDLRFKMGLALDTWMLPLLEDNDICEKVSQPILFINMEKFQTKHNLQLMSQMETYTVERKFVTIKGSVHLDHCDMSFVCGPIAYPVLSGFSRVNRFTAIDITTRLMLEFLGRNLNAKVEPEWESYLKRQEKRLKQGISRSMKQSLTQQV